MAGGVYSTRFILGVGGGPFLFAVPMGKRAIIKFASVVNPSATAQQGVVYINDTSVWVASVPGNSAANATGLMMVLNQGEVLKVVNTSSAMITSVHGYLLDL